MTTVRLYGVHRTNTSWGRVTAGVREGLEAIGALAGFVPVDDLDDDAVYAGADAPVAIFVGPPSMVGAMTSYGMHERRYAIVAPNSNWLPRDLIEEMQKFATIVAPSRWGAHVVETYTGQYVEPFFHGVSAGFTTHAVSTARLQTATDRLRDKGWFNVLHLASTERQRKGTRELIEAWHRLVSGDLLGPNPGLDIIVDAPRGMFGATHPTIQFPYRQLNAPAADMRALMQEYHLVCQPSRGEGFGLSPLEARASGVPVCVTDCTGHADHVEQGAPGVVVIATGPFAPIDDAPAGEMSLAPSLSSNDIAGALRECYERWPELTAAAREHADAVREKWSWPAVTENWLRKVGIEWTKASTT